MVKKTSEKTVPRSGSALAELPGGRAAVPQVEKSCDCAAAPMLVHYGLIVVAKATIPRRTGSDDVGVLASQPTANYQWSPRRARTSNIAMMVTTRGTRQVRQQCLTARFAASLCARHDPAIQSAEGIILPTIAVLVDFHDADTIAKRDMVPDILCRRRWGGVVPGGIRVLLPADAERVVLCSAFPWAL
jgi:hypothetical protein